MNSSQETDTPILKEQEPDRRLQAGLVAIWLLYLLVQTWVAWHHEPWLDEAQAWLLVKDSSLWNLLAHLLRYEGHPPLWYLWLWIPVKLGFPYPGIWVFSVVLAGAACWLILFRSPFPLPIRLLLPWGFFLFYQYGVIARSYSLLPPLVFWLAATWRFRLVRPLRFWMPVLLLMLGSVHGAVFALAAAGLTLLDLCRQWGGLTRDIRRATFGGLALVLATGGVLAAMLWPSHDTIAAIGLTHRNVVQFINQSLAATWWLSILAMGMGMLWMDRHRTLLAYVAVMSGLIILTGQVYKVYHEGIFYLAWIFAMWLAWDRSGTARKTDTETRECWTRWLGRGATVAMVVIGLIHAGWAVQSTRKELKKPYSGAEELAAFIREHVTSGQRMFATGIHAVAAVPYLRENPFVNLSRRPGQDFVYWSRHNRILNLDRKGNVAGVKEWIRRSDPDWLVVPVNSKQTRSFLKMALQLDGYQAVKLCKGEQFWKGGVFRLDGYMIFQQKRQGREIAK